MPLESSNLYLRGMTLKCRHCGYSGLPLASGACIYDRVTVASSEGQKEPFRDDLNPASIISKLALLSFFFSAASVWSPEMRPFTAGSFAAFLLLSLFYVVLRMRDAA
jgi:hypothetical protein